MRRRGLVSHLRAVKVVQPPNTRFIAGDGARRNLRSIGANARRPAIARSRHLQACVWPLEPHRQARCHAADAGLLSAHLVIRAVT
jgi:hypothetical protein